MHARPHACCLGEQRCHNTLDDTAVSATNSRWYQTKFRKLNQRKSSQLAVLVNNVHFNCYQCHNSYFMEYCTTSCDDLVIQIMIFLCNTCAKYARHVTLSCVRFASSHHPSARIRRLHRILLQKTSYYIINIVDSQKTFHL